MGTKNKPCPARTLQVTQFIRELLHVQEARRDALEHEFTFRPRYPISNARTFTLQRAVVKTGGKKPKWGFSLRVDGKPVEFPKSGRVDQLKTLIDALQPHVSRARLRASTEFQQSWITLLFDLSRERSRDGGQLEILAGWLTAIERYGIICGTDVARVAATHLKKEIHYLQNQITEMKGKEVRDCDARGPFSPSSKAKTIFLPESLQSPPNDERQERIRDACHEYVSQKIYENLHFTEDRVNTFTRVASERQYMTEVRRQADDFTHELEQISALWTPGLRVQGERETTGGEGEGEDEGNGWRFIQEEIAAYFHPPDGSEGTRDPGAESEKLSAAEAGDARDGPAWLIYGPLGMGKTTFAKDLFVRLVDDYLTDRLAPLPIWISSPEITSGSLHGCLTRPFQPLLEFLESILDQASTGSRDVVLVLDALDEIRANATRVDLLKYLETLVTQGVFLVVTSRPGPAVSNTLPVHLPGIREAHLSYSRDHLFRDTPWSRTSWWMLVTLSRSLQQLVHLPPSPLLCTILQPILARVVDTPGSWHWGDLELPRVLKKYYAELTTYARDVKGNLASQVTVNDLLRAGRRIAPQLVDHGTPRTVNMGDIRLLRETGICTGNRENLQFTHELFHYDFLARYLLSLEGPLDAGHVGELLKRGARVGFSFAEHAFEIARARNHLEVPFLHHVAALPPDNALFIARVQALLALHRGTPLPPLVAYLFDHLEDPLAREAYISVGVVFPQQETGLLERAPEIFLELGQPPAEIPRFIDWVINNVDQIQTPDISENLPRLPPDVFRVLLQTADPFPPLRKLAGCYVLDDGQVHLLETLFPTKFSQDFPEIATRTFREKAPALLESVQRGFLSLSYLEHLKLAQLPEITKQIVKKFGESRLGIFPIQRRASVKSAVILERFLDHGVKTRDLDLVQDALRACVHNPRTFQVIAPHLETNSKLLKTLLSMLQDARAAEPTRDFLSLIRDQPALIKACLPHFTRPDLPAFLLREIFRRSFGPHEPNSLELQQALCSRLKALLGPDAKLDFLREARYALEFLAKRPNPKPLDLPVWLTKEEITHHEELLEAAESRSTPHKMLTREAQVYLFRQFLANPDQDAGIVSHLRNFFLKESFNDHWFDVPLYSAGRRVTPQVVWRLLHKYPRFFRPFLDILREAPDPLGSLEAVARQEALVEEFLECFWNLLLPSLSELNYEENAEFQWWDFLNLFKSFSVPLHIQERLVASYALARGILASPAQVNYYHPDLLAVVSRLVREVPDFVKRYLEEEYEINPDSMFHAFNPELRQLIVEHYDAYVTTFQDRDLFRDFFFPPTLYYRTNWDYQTAHPAFLEGVLDIYPEARSTQVFRPYFHALPDRAREVIRDLLQERPPSPDFKELYEMFLPEGSLRWVKGTKR